MLQRTQLMLDIQTKQDLQYLASITNRSMSELVREFVAEKVKQEKKKLKKNHKQQIKNYDNRRIDSQISAALDTKHIG